MKQLYIYAYPAQMITFQLINNNQGEENVNCAFYDIVLTTKRFLDSHSIDTIFIVGTTDYAAKVEELVTDRFSNIVIIERVKND